jgi:hypothetical protein
MHVVGSQTSEFKARSMKDDLFELADLGVDVEFHQSILAGQWSARRVDPRR